MRPTTGPTVYHDDVVGIEVARGRRAQIDTAYDEGRICRESDPDWPFDVPVREETIPVRRAGAVIAVVSRHTNLAAARTPSRLELTYLRSADDLARMLADGALPGRRLRRPGPRVTPRRRRADPARRARASSTFASPNALSAFRRLGVDALTSSAFASARRRRPCRLPTARSTRRSSRCSSGRAARQTEVEAAGAIVRLRVIPLTARRAAHAAALVLCRDVTEVRHRERELVGKDVTIREIHHRVKNNLQTVAALLRLQARRLEDGRARAALEEAQRRVGSIALVHETLSQTMHDSVDFDEVADRIAEMVGGADDAERPVTVDPDGQLRAVPPEVATPMSLVLVELLQNAVEHGLADEGGAVDLRVHRNGASLTRHGRRRGPRPARGRSTRSGRAAWGCRSCGRWSSPSSAGGWPCGRAPSGRGCDATVESLPGCLPQPGLTPRRSPGRSAGASWNVRV